MNVVNSQKYLGDIISSSGTLRDTIEDRRNKGWGKLSEISGILSEMPDMRKVEVGLNLRMAKLVNGTIYSSEAWGKVTEAELTRLKQVDFSLLRSLVSGHSKTSRAFTLLEFGVFSIRHLIMIRRLMYHHHLVTRTNNELIKKVYLKQKQCSLKGDWYRTLQEDFVFIGEEIDDEKIVSFSKDQYKSYIKEKVMKSAFQSYLVMKEQSKKKLKSLEYKSFGIQQYIISEKFSLKQIKLLYSLRSKCYPAKMNFKKMNKGDLKCIFLCNQEETQDHIFEACPAIRQKLDICSSMKLDSIYGDVTKQLEAIQVFEKIDDMRTLMRKELL
jgi:hypothetical protein